MFIRAGVLVIAGIQLFWLATHDRTILTVSGTDPDRILITPGTMQLLDQFGPFGTLNTLTTIGAGVLWLVWQYQATRAAAQRVPGLRTTPGWAVAWWLIPIANLFMPAVTMAELRRATGRTEASRSAGLVIVWWIAYQGTQIVATVAILAALVPRFLSNISSDGTVTIRSGDAPVGWALAGLAQLVAAASALMAVRILNDVDEGLGILTGQAVPPRPDLPLTDAG